MGAGAAATEGGSAADRIMAGTETFARRAPAGGSPGRSWRSRSIPRWRPSAFTSGTAIGT